MKKIVCSIGLAVGLVSNSFASGVDLGALNARVNEVIAPIQNSVTTANASFSVLNMEDDDIYQIGFTGYYRKLGNNNNFLFNLDALYDYNNDGDPPLFKLKTGIRYDLSKVIPSNVLNDDVLYAMTVGFAELLQLNMVLGNAFTIENLSTTFARDDEGNYSNIYVSFRSNIDFDHLPRHVRQEEIPVTDLSASFIFNVNLGVTLETSITLNPEYQDFEMYQALIIMNLKKFSEGDEATMDELKSMIAMADSWIADLVEQGDFLRNFDLKKYLKVAK